MMECSEAMQEAWHNFEYDQAAKIAYANALKGQGPMRWNVRKMTNSYQKNALAKKISLLCKEKECSAVRTNEFDYW